eukprot:2869185-Alexandrium_andersonii.AAC.1
MFGALPAVLRAHADVRVIPVVDQHKVIILPRSVRVLGGPRVFAPAPRAWWKVWYSGTLPGGTTSTSVSSDEQRS